MTYKQVETAREIRLWIGQLIIPAAVLLMASPEARHFVKVKASKAKDYVNDKLHK